MMSINRKPLTSIENILALDSDRNHESVQSFKSPALNAMSTDSNFDKLQEIIDNFVKNPAVAHRANRLIQNLRKQILAFDNSVGVVTTVASREVTSHKSSTINTEESSAITATISAQKDRCASRKDRRDICSKNNALKNDHAKMTNDVDDEHLDGKQFIRRSNRRASISTTSVVSVSHNKSLITQKKVKQPREISPVNASRTTDIVTNQNKVFRKQLQRQPQFDRGRDLMGSFDRLYHTKRLSYPNLPVVPCVSDDDAEDVKTDGIIKVCQDPTCQSKLKSAEDLSANKENRGAETEFNNNAAAHSDILHADSPFKSSPIKDSHPVSNIDFFHEKCQTPQIKCTPTVVMTEEEEKSTIIFAMSAVKTIMLDIQPDQELEENSRIRNFVPFKFHIYDTNTISNESFIEESGVISSPATIFIPHGNDNLQFRCNSSPKRKRSSQSYKSDIDGGELKDCNLHPENQKNGGERTISFVPILEERMLISPITSPSRDSTESYISEQVNSSGQEQSQISDVLTTDVKLSEKSLPTSPKLVRRSATFESFADLKSPLPLTMYSVDAVEVLQQDLLLSADFHEEPMGESCSDVIIVEGPKVTLDSAVKIIPIFSPLNACRSQSLGWPTNLTKAFLPGEDGSNVKRQDLHLLPMGCISSSNTEIVSDNTLDLDQGDSLLHHVSHFGKGEKQCTKHEQLKEVCNSVFDKEEEEEGVINHDVHSESIDDGNNIEKSCMPQSADHLVISSTAMNNIQLVSQTSHCDMEGVVVPTIPNEEPTHVHGSISDINDVHCTQKNIIGSSAAVIQNLNLEVLSLCSVKEHHLLHGIHGIFSSKAILDWSLKLILTIYNSNNVKAFRSDPGFGFIVALVSLMYNCPIWHPPDTITDSSASVSRTHTQALLTTTTALTALISHMTVSKDEMADRYHCVLSPKRHRKSERKVHFCDIDGSSVSTPSPITSHRPIFSASKRLHSIIKGIDHLTAVLLHIDNSDGCTDRSTSNCHFDSILSSCELLAKATSAAYVSRAMLDQLSIDSKPRDVLAIANLLATELKYVRKLNEQRVSLNASNYLVPSILRHRAAWMATSALRSQLRWLLDPPPQALTAGSGNLYAVSSSPWCTLYKVVTVEDSLQTPSNRRKSIKLDNVLTVKMTLSSLVTQALRQIYDAFIAAADSFLSVGHGTVDNVVTEFLMAAVTVTEDPGSNESSDITISLALFDGLSESQPQLALAALKAKEFLTSLLSIRPVQEVLEVQSSVWKVVQQSALLISVGGMSEDRHLCMLCAGWKGLLEFSKQPLLSDEAERRCLQYVSTLRTVPRKRGTSCDDETIPLSCFDKFPSLTVNSPAY